LSTVIIENQLTQFICTKRLKCSSTLYRLVEIFLQQTKILRRRMDFHLHSVDGGAFQRRMNPMQSRSHVTNAMTPMVEERVAGKRRVSTAAGRDHIDFIAPPARSAAESLTPREGRRHIGSANTFANRVQQHGFPPAREDVIRRKGYVPGSSHNTVFHGTLQFDAPRTRAAAGTATASTVHTARKRSHNVPQEALDLNYMPRAHTPPAGALGLKRFDPQNDSRRVMQPLVEQPPRPDGIKIVAHRKEGLDNTLIPEGPEPKTGRRYVGCAQTLSFRI
jgi:hypothetical protein